MGLDLSASDLEPGGANNLFLLAPALGSGLDAACMGLLSVAPPERTNMLCVTSVRTPDEWLEAWSAHVGSRFPAQTAFVNIGGETRAAAERTRAAAEAIDGTVTVSTVSSPSNLTQIGVEISRQLADWESGDARVVFCFDSLTTLLQYTDIATVFRFLHQLTGHLRAVNAVAHYHMDPTAHEQQDLNRLKTLFDAIVEPDDRGDWQLLTR